jgi:hypothetical protein
LVRLFQERPGMKQPTTVENMPIQAAPGAIDTATLDLLAKWKAEDATTDPTAIQAAEREVSEFKRAMNANRAESGGPPVFS